MPPGIIHSVTIVEPKLPLVDHRVLHNAIREVNNRYAKQAQALYYKTTATWVHQPTFVITDGEVTGPGQSFEFATMVQPEGIYKDQFRWIDAGTRRRFAVMTPDFRPKTRRGPLTSRPGRGGKSHMSLQPYPGIEAREFSKGIADRLFRNYVHSMRAAVSRSLRTKDPRPSYGPAGKLIISAAPRRF